MNYKLKNMNTLGLVAAGGLLLVGCSGPDYSQAVYEESEPTMVESSGTQTYEVAAQPSGQAATATSSASGDEWVIPLHEEKVNVGKKSVDAGQVTIRKVVTTETVSQPVELRKEKIMIERKTAGGAAEGASSGQADAFGNAFEEKTVTIQLQEEQPVVEKTTVQSGSVVARKNVEWDKQTVQREIRKEDVQLDQTGDAAIQGDINKAQAPGSSVDEAAGAEKATGVEEEPAAAPKTAPRKEGHKDAEYLNQLPPGQIDE